MTAVDVPRLPDHVGPLARSSTSPARTGGDEYLNTDVSITAVNS